MPELTHDGVEDFLIAAGLLEEAARVTVEELGGGISNIVLRVSAPERCLVVKQSLPKLRVQADWPFDQRRTLGERDCLALLGRLVPGAVPEMLHCDEASFTLVISCVPAGGVLWKRDLLRGLLAAFEGWGQVPAPAGWSRVYARLSRSPDPEVRGR